MAQQIPAKVQVKSGRLSQLCISFGTGQANQVLSLTSNWRPSNAAYRHKENRAFSVSFVTADGTVDIREGRGDPNANIQPRNPNAVISIPFDHYDVAICEITNDEFRLRLNLKRGRQFSIVTQGAEQHQNGIFLGWRRNLIPQCRYVTVSIPRLSSATHTPTTFDFDIIHATLLGEINPDPAKLIDNYCGLMKSAIQADSEEADQARENMTRSDVRAKLERLPEMQGRLYVTLDPPDNSPAWQLEPRMGIVIEPMTANDAGLFNQTPQAPPDQPGASGWLAKIVVRNNNLCGVIENPTNHIPPAEIDRMIQNPVQVKVTVDPMDPETEKAMRTANLFQIALHRERRKDTSASEDLPNSFHVPLMPIYLSSWQWGAAVTRYVMDNNVNPFVEPLRTQYGLQEQSHCDAVQKALGNTRGIGLIKGPPATGKTTLVAKLVLIALKHGSLTPGKIVLAAHSNEAVRVATRRICAILRDYGYDPLDTLCLVMSRAQSEYFRMSDNEFGELENLTLDSHIERIVNAAQGSWGDYRAGLAEIKSRGRIETPELKKLYDNQRKLLISQVKGNTKIFCATLAMCHDRHEVFGRHPARMNCKLAVIDEASQAPDYAFAQLDLALNPRQKILVGDPNQLNPFTQSQLARTAWGNKSLFARLWDKKPQGAPGVTLDVQYRTTPNTYAGTNYHYNGIVKNHASTQNRHEELELRQKLGRISFKEINSGKIHHFTNNTHILNLKNATSRTVGATQTWVNGMEGDFVKGFVAALIATGYRADWIMALTPYNGQYDSLLPLEKKYKGVQVRKIDSSQGDEAELIIFSMTRTIGQSLGFLNQSRRQNVGTSRARNGFMSVCNFALMMTGDVWKAWYNALLNANPNNLKIDFEGPVKFLVDGQEVVDPPRAPQPPAAQASGAESQTRGGGSGSHGRAPSIVQPPVPPPIGQPPNTGGGGGGSGTHNRAPSIIQPPGGLPRSACQPDNLGGGGSGSRTHSRAASIVQPPIPPPTGQPSNTGGGSGGSRTHSRSSSIIQPPGGLPRSGSHPSNLGGGGSGGGGSGNRSRNQSYVADARS